MESYRSDASRKLCQRVDLEGASTGLEQSDEGLQDGLKVVSAEMQEGHGRQTDPSGGQY